MPPGYNHPARVAERIATLDLVSNGRVEFGTGESSALLELGGYRVPVEKKREMWRETVEQCLNMMVMNPYPGFKGEYFEMPCRNIVPKPVQKPHPPVWVACSNRETIKLAARLGIGALTFAFVDPQEAKQWVDDYYRILKEECVPIGHAVNANIAMVTGFSVHNDREEARRRGLDGFRFFGYALGHHYIFGEHKPGRTDIWKNFEAARDHMPANPGAGGIGTPDEMRAHLRKFAKAGVDQVAFIQQGGPQQARAHLRGARTLRPRRHAGVQGARIRASAEESGRTRAFHRKGVRAQAEDEGTCRRRDSERHRAWPPDHATARRSEGRGIRATLRRGRRRATQRPAGEACRVAKCNFQYIAAIIVFCRNSSSRIFHKRLRKRGGTGCGRSSGVSISNVRAGAG